MHLVLHKQPRTQSVWLRRHRQAANKQSMNNQQTRASRKRRVWHLPQQARNSTNCNKSHRVTCWVTSPCQLLPIVLSVLRCQNQYSPCSFPSHAHCGWILTSHRQPTLLTCSCHWLPCSSARGPTLVSKQHQGSHPLLRSCQPIPQHFQANRTRSEQMMLTRSRSACRVSSTQHAHKTHS